MNFDGSGQGNRAGATFIVKNDIDMLVGANNIHAAFVSMPRVEIRDL